MRFGLEVAFLRIRTLHHLNQHQLIVCAKKQHFESETLSMKISPFHLNCLSPSPISFVLGGNILEICRTRGCVVANIMSMKAIGFSYGLNRLFQIGTYQSLGEG